MKLKAAAMSAPTATVPVAKVPEAAPLLIVATGPLVVGVADPDELKDADGELEIVPDA